MASTMRLGMRFATQLQAPSRRILVQQFRQPQFKLLPSSTSILSQRLAPFSTTTHRKILPPGPQVIHGGVNTPAPVPAPQYVTLYLANCEAIIEISINNGITFKNQC